MTTITIPNNLIKEKDLVVLPRIQYNNLLKYFTDNKGFQDLWNDAIKKTFLESYSLSDSIYDKV